MSILQAGYRLFVQRARGGCDNLAACNRFDAPKVESFSIARFVSVSLNAFGIVL
jgi:hypothetical protein